MTAVMRVLVLGGAGFVGRRVAACLREAGHAVTVASRRAQPGAEDVSTQQIDARDVSSLQRAVQAHDAVVNCVTGTGADIIDSARSLILALHAGGTCRRLVHMSSMAAFGDLEGDLDDDTPLGAGGGWYAEAKRTAEQVLATAADNGVHVVLLRPGCVHGPGSHLWVRRLGDALRRRRLGDLGSAGDGWSNLVHVDDVARAAVHSLTHAWSSAAAVRVNLSAPDSPRWNDYLVALGCAIGATPVARISRHQLLLDAYAAAVPLRVLERLAQRLGVAERSVPPALPPSLLKLFAQDRRLRSPRASEQLGLRWTAFEAGVADSAAWYLDSKRGAQ